MPPRAPRFLFTTLLAACGPGAASDGGPSSASTDSGDTTTDNDPDDGSGSDTDSSDSSDTGDTGEGDDLACGPDGVVPGDELVLQTQQEVEFVAGCTEVAGSLIIRGPDIVDLRPLSTLTQVGRGLKIMETVQLVSLTGLESIHVVHWDVTITDNAALTDLRGLSGLTNAGRGLENERNAQLTSLIGLEQISELEPIEDSVTILIRENPRLTSLAGLEWVGAGRDDLGIFIASNDQLVDLSALANVTRLDYLRLQGNVSLTDLGALSRLERLTTLQLLETSFTSLQSFRRLREVEDISVVGNPNLPTLAGFDSVEKLQAFIVDRNLALESLGSWPTLANIERFGVSGNPRLASLGQMPLQGEAIGDFSLVDCPQLTDLSALAGVTTYGSRFRLDRLGSITDLAMFEHVERVRDDIVIINNATLSQVDAEQWASTRGATYRKVDGNLGAEPHEDDCPWVLDSECDEASGTGLCPEGSDPDCIDEDA